MPDRGPKSRWTRVRFGDAVRLVGDRCEPAAESIERYVGLEHLEPEDLRVRTWGLVSQGTTFTNRFRPGQVLFGKRRAYQRKVAVADFEGVCSGDIYVMESASPERCLPELLPFLCQTDAFFEHAVGTSAGSLSPRTNWTSLANYEFALPPPKEQRSIAEALRASSTCAQRLNDAARSAQTLIDAYLLEYFQVHPLAGRAGGFRNAHTREVCLLGDVLEVLQDGTHNPSKDRSDDGPMLLSVTHLDGERLTYGEDESRVSWSFYLREQKRLQPRAGDALLAIIGFSLGKTGTVQADIPPFVLQRMVAVLRADQERLEQQFLRSYLDSSVFQHHLWSRSKQTQQPAVYLGEIAKIPIPVPDKKEQCRFIEVVEDLRSNLHRLKARVRQCSNFLKELREALL